MCVTVSQGGQARVFDEIEAIEAIIEDKKGAIHMVSSSRLDQHMKALVVMSQTLGAKCGAYLKTIDQENEKDMAHYVITIKQTSENFAIDMKQLVDASTKAAASAQDAIEEKEKGGS
jgi:hypothetical protein